MKEHVAYCRVFWDLLSFKAEIMVSWFNWRQGRSQKFVLGGIKVFFGWGGV